MRESAPIILIYYAQLYNSYSNGMKIGGVIYLHDISLPRLHPASLRNIEVFRRLCGDRALSSVVLATTKWGLVNEQDGTKREAQLLSGLWKDIISAGSSVDRFDNTRESAWRIIKRILHKFENTYNSDSLQIQGELVDFIYRIPETEGGKALRMFTK